MYHIKILSLAVIFLLLSGSTFPLFDFVKPALAQTGPTVDTYSIAGAESLTLNPGSQQYFFVGSTAGGYQMSSMTWSPDLNVVASYSNNLGISIGHQTSNSGSYSSQAGNHGIAGIGMSNVGTYQTFTAQTQSGTSVSLQFTVGSNDLVVILAGGEGDGSISLSGATLQTLEDHTYSEAGSNVIASEAIYDGQLSAGTYTVNLSTITYPTNSGTSLGVVAYVFSNSTSSGSSSLSDTFTSDTSLNTNLWEINGPVGTAFNSVLGSPPGTLVNPTLIFSNTNGMGVSGVSGTYQTDTIQSVQSFSAPFTVQSTVMGTQSVGDAFLLAITTADASQGIDIAGNLNSGNAPYYGINYDVPSGGVWNTQGKLFSSPSLNTEYSLSISVSSSGLATETVSSNGQQLGTATYQVGTGPFYLILAQHEGAPTTGAGPNQAYWQSIQATGGGSSSGGSGNTGTFPVTFTESGLYPGTSWSVTLGGNTLSSTSTSITFNEPNGNYQFSVTPPPSYKVVPYSGTLTLNGSPLSQSLTFVPPVQESGSTPVSMSLTGTVSGLITNMQVTLTSGTITAGGATYPVTGSPGQYCNQNNVVCNSPNGILSAGSIQLPSGLVLGLASCYTQVNNNQLSLSFYNGRPNTCGGTTAIVQPPSNTFYCPFNATGTLTISGSQAVITASGTGNCNLPITVTTPGAPAGLTATAISSSQISLSWNAPTNTGGSPVTGYLIKRSTPGGSYSTIALVNAYPTTYMDHGLSPNTPYDYVVYAINSAGTGQPSNVAPATIVEILDVLGYGTNPAMPIEDQPFNIVLTVSNQGNVPINPDEFPFMGSSSNPDPSTDAQQATPNLTCNLISSSAIPLYQVSSLVYQCTARWNFMVSQQSIAGSTIGGGITTLYTTFADAISQLPIGSALTLYDMLHFLANTGINLDNNEAQIMTDVGSTYPAPSNIFPSNPVAGLAYMYQNEQATPGVTYTIQLSQQDNFGPKIVLETPSSQIQVPVIDTQSKIDGAYQYINAQVNSGTVSIMSSTGATISIGATASTAPLCVTIIGCIVPAAFGAASVFFLSVSAYEAYNILTDYQTYMKDPSSNYTEFVNVSPPPSLIVSLQNTTAGKGLYYLTLYNNYVNASLISNARAFGAISNNSTYYAYLQTVKAEQYAEDASLNFMQFKSYLNQTLQQLNNAGFLNQSTFEQGQKILQEQGLPQNVVTILNALGITNEVNTTQLETMKYMPINSTTLLSIRNIGADLASDDQSYLSFLPTISTQHGPTLNIISPLSNSFSNHGVIDVTGTTQDTGGIQKVTVSIDGNQPFPATLNFGAYSNSTLTWAYTTPPLPDGSHVIIANSTANNGVNSLSSVLVTVDATPPEAYIHFDPTSKNIILYGNDSLSGIPNNPINPINPISVVPAKLGHDDKNQTMNENTKSDNSTRMDKDNATDNNNDEYGKDQGELRTYDIADRAGNTLKLVEKVMLHGNEIKAHIISLQYNNGSVVSVGKNEEKFEWSTGKNGTIKELEQHVILGGDKNRQYVDAKYSLKDNTTVIEIKNQSEHTTRITEPGLVLLNTETNQGKLLVNGY